ncbi:MAG TPA: helix-turn-helix domain-containing protein, partial [Gaiellales bacterium]|nr:helix-turn-helix domain-containing protein [Gaiellales bacterium]
MIRIGPLSDARREALERVRRRAVGRVSQRAHMVLLSARGYAVEQIAEIFGVGEDVVRKWLRRYERQGPEGLDDRPR